jgi:hypothetical protein
LRAQLARDIGFPYSCYKRVVLIPWTKVRSIFEMRWTKSLIFVAALLLPSLASAQTTPPAPQPPVPRPPIERPEVAGPDMSAQTENPATPGADQSGSDLPTPANAQNLSPAPPLAPAPAVGLPQPVTLSARISEGGQIIPDGLVWRVFANKTDETGQLALLYKSEDAAASFSLPEGEYLVHVAYGRSQASEPLIVEPGPNVKTVILQAGALRLRSAVSGDTAIPPSQLRFDIFTSGLDEARVPVALNVESDALIRLNAGTYNVVSKWGDINATVRADIRVEPSQVTEATLFHRAAQIAFKLASNIGGEAIADVDWTVTDTTGTTLFQAVGAFPVVVLAEGEYSVIAQQGDDIYNRDFQVRAGPPREIEVLTTVY